MLEFFDHEKFMNDLDFGNLVHFVSPSFMKFWPSINFKKSIKFPKVELAIKIIDSRMSSHFLSLPSNKIKR